jgi:hypothetical protein
MIGRPEARRMIRSAASSASVPVVRNTTRSVRFGHTESSFSAASMRWTLLPALVQQATPCWRSMAFTTSTISGLQLPTLLVPQPEPKSMKRLPSTSSMSEPRQLLAMKVRFSRGP